ncbi:MAG: ribonuclease HI family protein [Thermomicrobiales bacterium]
MTAEPNVNLDTSLLVDVDPEQLSREQLIDLVRDLQRALVDRVRTTSAVNPPIRQPARPVPGADYTIVFDGGSLGNPGLGYGSYEIVGADGSVAARQIEFGNGMTNNQAEFRALIAGLDDLWTREAANANELSIAVRGDSQLVIRGLSGEWRVKHPGLQPLHRQASELLKRFRHVDLAWHPRRESLRTFGH